MIAQKNKLGCLTSTFSMPLVKEFIDHDKEIIRFLEVRLPHIPGTTMKINPVYSTETRRHYRVNWYFVKWNGFIPEQTIKASNLVVVNTVGKLNIEKIL